MQSDIRLIDGNVLTTYIVLLSDEKMELGDGPLEKLAAGIFFRYQIPFMNFV